MNRLRNALLIEGDCIRCRKAYAPGTGLTDPP